MKLFLAKSAKKTLEGIPKDCEIYRNGRREPVIFYSVMWRNLALIS